MGSGCRGRSRRDTYRSDKTEGPTTGLETVDALEFLARLVMHIPDPHRVLTPYYGWYANRTRGMRRRTGGTDAAPPVESPAEVGAPVPLPLREARRRWAQLLRRIFEVDPLLCPRSLSRRRESMAAWTLEA